MRFSGVLQGDSGKEKDRSGLGDVVADHEVGIGESFQENTCAGMSRRVMRWLNHALDYIRNMHSFYYEI